MNSINFDIIEFTIDNRKTDILGNIKDVSNIFKPETFSIIYCIHVLEHFYLSDALQLIKDCYIILKTHGKLIMEGPDIIKMVSLCSKDAPKLVSYIYGNEAHRKQWGNQYMHKWGWTGDSVEKIMIEQKFQITYKGEGLSHHHANRDWKVEGTKIR